MFEGKDTVNHVDRFNKAMNAAEQAGPVNEYTTVGTTTTTIRTPLRHRLEMEKVRLVERLDIITAVLDTLNPDIEKYMTVMDALRKLGYER